MSSTRSPSRSVLSVVALAGTLAFALAPAACGDDHHHHHGDGGATCAGDPRAETYVAGMTKQGPTLKVLLESAEPAPPARFDNQWTIRVLDAADQPRDGLSLVVTPWMPDHNHGSQTPAVVTPLGDGRYDVDPVDLWMPGLWEVRIAADDNGTANQVVFSFCIGA